MRVGPDRLVLAIALVILVGGPALATVLRATHLGPARNCPWESPEEPPIDPDRGSAMVDPGAAISTPMGPAWGTIRLVAGSTALALPLGVVLAFLLFRTDIWGRKALLALVLLVLFVPTPLHATAWLGSFGNQGRSQALGSSPILVGLPGAAFVHAMASLPWVVLLVGVGLRTVEPELEESALMDLPAWRVALQMTLRRALGAIAAAALAVAVLTAGDMTVTDLLQVRTYAEECYLQIQVNGFSAAAGVAVAPTLVLGVLILGAARALLRSDPSRLASADIRPKLWRLGAWRMPLGLLAWATLGNILALPIYGLVWRAGRVGRAMGRSHWSVGGLLATLHESAADVLPPLIKSALWAAIAATLTLVIAWPLAWLSRKPGVWRWVAAVVVALLLACPGPVAGMSLVLAYNAAPPCLDQSLLPWMSFLGRIFVYDRPVIVVLAYVLRTLPYAVLILWPATRGVADAHVESAEIDGYNARGVARRVGLPLTLGAALAAWGASFVLSVGELPAANLVEPPSHTMFVSKLIWSLLHTGVESHLAGVGLVLLLAIGGVGVLVGWGLAKVYRID
jgi:iron(III) transport system permease protein